MNRRGFVSLAALGAAAPVSRPASGKVAPTSSRLKLGCQSGPITDRRLSFFKRNSVDNICGLIDRSDSRPVYTVAELSALRERCEKHRVSLDMITPPFLEAGHIDGVARPSIMLGKSPERDQDIEDFCKLIRNCAAARIPAVKYNLNILGVLRTEPEVGRGGAIHRAWRLPAAKVRGRQLTRAGRVTADVFWERIDYFLQRVVPVAAENKVRIACHPHDPSVPSGFQGVDVVLGSVDGLKRFVALHENPYHGLNFCQGTVSEMLADPGKEIFDVIRYFGTRQKIFNVHFRNIRGHRDSFRESYPDEGDVDFVRAIAVYQEVGYPYMLMPDHIPTHPDDPEGLQAFAFCYGYIRALIQAAPALVAAPDGPGARRG
jgi:mannonate dehydratase